MLHVFTLSTSDVLFSDIRNIVVEPITLPFQPSRLMSSPFGRVNQLVRLRDLSRLSRIGYRVSAMIDAQSFDVCLVYPCQFSISPAVLARSSTPTLYYRQDVVRWVHDPPIMRPYGQQTSLQSWFDRIDPLRRAFYRMLVALDRRHMAAASRVVVASCFVREALYRAYGTAPSLSRLGVDSEAFRPGTAPRSDYVLSVGMIVPAKGYDFLIESLGLVDPDRRPRLVIVGNVADPREVAYLEQLAAQQGVRLDLRVMVDHGTLLDLYQRARCTVYVPVMESFGLVPLESMACGTPVIGICEGGVRETVLDGRTGLLVERDPSQLAAAVERLRTDDGLATHLAETARREVVERWSLRKSIDTLEQHLVEVAGMSRTRGAAWTN